MVSDLVNTKLECKVGTTADRDAILRDSLQPTDRALQKRHGTGQDVLPPNVQRHQKTTHKTHVVVGGQPAHADNFNLWLETVQNKFAISDQIGMVHGGEEIVSARYDAVSIISLGIGFSWILVIGVLTTLILSLSRFFGMVVDNESRIRIRILLISFSLILLSLPKTYDGLRIIISLLTVFFADSISRLTPIFEK